MNMWNWNTLGTALLVLIAKIGTFIVVVAGVVIGGGLGLGIVGGILYGSWLGLNWLYHNISLAGFLWFCGALALLIIIFAGLKESYKHVQQTSHLTFWEKVWGESKK